MTSFFLPCQGPTELRDQVLNEKPKTKTEDRNRSPRPKGPGLFDQMNPILKDQVLARNRVVK
jgi:hypothetical protein